MALYWRLQTGGSLFHLWVIILHLNEGWEWWLGFRLSDAYSTNISFFILALNHIREIIINFFFTHLALLSLAELKTTLPSCYNCTLQLQYTLLILFFPTAFNVKKHSYLAYALQSPVFRHHILCVQTSISTSKKFLFTYPYYVCWQCTAYLATCKCVFLVFLLCQVNVSIILFILFILPAEPRVEWLLKLRSTFHSCKILLSKDHK